MSQSRRPVKKLIRNLALMSEYWNPVTGQDLGEADPVDEAAAFQRELDLMAEAKSIDLPPNTLKYFITSNNGKTQRLCFIGFRLSNL
jgi:hypothetical protein